MEINQAVRALAALAQESRLETFRLLVRAGTEGLPAGKIAEDLGVPPATLSFHLKELANAGLIEQRRDGRSIINTLNVKGMQSLLAFLVEDCCQGQPHLCEPAFALINCCDERSQTLKHSKTGRSVD
jgi:ArsR family transcriptional regulator, arsenate/arsenite/antimonite-responsive transcriptional repressor